MGCRQGFAPCAPRSPSARGAATGVPVESPCSGTKRLRQALESIPVTCRPWPAARPNATKPPVPESDNGQLRQQKRRTEPRRAAPATGRRAMFISLPSGSPANSMCFRPPPPRHPLPVWFRPSGRSIRTSRTPRSPGAGISGPPGRPGRPLSSESFGLVRVPSRLRGSERPPLARQGTLVSHWAVVRPSPRSRQPCGPPTVSAGSAAARR